MGLRAEAGHLFETETPRVLGGRGWRLGGSSERVRLVDKIWGREPGRAGGAGCAMRLAGRGQDARVC